MAITGTVMVQASSTTEYGVLVTTKTGISRIYHLNKKFESIDPVVNKYITTRANSMSGGRHYFATELETAPKDVEVSIVEISCQNLRDANKWNSVTFLEAYIDFHLPVSGQPGAVLRKVSGMNRLPTIEFPSFVEFMRQAYPNDYARWKMLESDLRWVRETFSIPTLR